MGRVTGGVSGKSDFSKRVSTGICTIETFDGTPPGGSDPISIPDGIDDLPRGQDLMCERVPIVLVPKEIGVAHDDQVERQPQADELSCYGRIEIPLTLHVIEYHQQIEIATILGFVTRDGTEYYDHPRVGGIHDPADDFVHLGVIEQSGSSYVDRCDITHHRIGDPFESCGSGTTMPYESRFRIEWNDSVALESGTCFDEFVYIIHRIAQWLPSHGWKVQEIEHPVLVEYPDRLLRRYLVSETVLLDAMDLEPHRLRLTHGCSGHTRSPSSSSSNNRDS